MHLASLSFLYLFLPLSLAVYYLCPARFRWGALLGISLLFYLLKDPQHLPLLFCSVLADYLLGRFMERAERNNRSRKAAMLCMVVKNLGLFIGLSSYLQLKGDPVPFGLPVYTLFGLGYALDIYSGEGSYAHHFGKFLLAHSLFMKLPAGPLVRYGSLKESFAAKKASVSAIGDGFLLFLQGISKQVLLGRPCKQLYLILSQFTVFQQSVFSLWLLPVCTAMSLYFTLSGFCDMARGLGAMFGVSLPRNFYYPYQSRSITDFVGRFNISVTDYLKAYVYHPLGADSGAFISSSLNIGLVTLLWGLWFGFRINYLLWGLFFFLLILLERGLWGKILSRLPVFLSRVYTFCLVLISFVIFDSASFAGGLFHFRGMLGLAGLPIFTSSALYYAGQYAPYLILSVVFSTSLPHSAKTMALNKNPSFWAVASTIVYLFLLALTTGFLLNP